ncbi:C1 family peptidase, partial [Methanobrevibacter millerae]
GAVCAADDISDEIISDDGQEDMYMVDEASFTDLTDEINNTGTTLDLTKDYAFNNATDDSNGIVIAKDNFVLNGNGRTIDGNNQSRLFTINGNNITLNDLILINGNSANCGGIRAVGTLTLNNVTFISNHANKEGGALGIREGAFIISNCIFIDNFAESGSSIVAESSEVKLYNSSFTSKNSAKGSQIDFSHAEVYIENTTFTNITASYAPAIYIKYAKKASIVNSKFIDLKANITAGAIATKSGGEIYIENCEFENVTSSKNGGAIFADVAGDKEYAGNVTIIGTKFKDTYSEFGGAYVQLSGDFVLKNTEFINSHAEYNGGVIYLSYTNTEINNCTFDSNGVSIIEGYLTYGGAIFSDKSTLNINDSKFFNNGASAGSAIYAYDTSYNIRNSTFENNTNPIYTVFDGESVLENNDYVNDGNLSLNNTYYETIIIGQGMQLVLLNNTINITDIPDKFDLRDYGWVSSVKNQGWMGACWTFGMIGTLESALLKAANITTDFSENNMQNTMIQYSIYGCGGTGEFGANILSTAYLLSWLGAFTQDADTYDEVGKISPVITTLNDVHVQDVMFTPNIEIPNGTQLKLAIMKYGSIDVSFFGQSTYDEVNPYYNPETHAQYVDTPEGPNHDVSIVGWDDNYNASNFLITPPGNGAWIVKNSYSTEWGDNGFLYVSYYDKTLMNSKDVSNYATSIIIENTEPYNKNYQYSLMWGTEFKSGNQNVSYMNVFEALDDDLIAAVGTYFNKEGNDYTVEIYVNDELKLTQTGVSPYYGYHTIKLNEYIPIKEGDVFKAAITSNVAPTVNLTDVRPHYTQNLSFISFDGESMKDTYDSGYIVCLKVYTVADSNKNNTFTELERLINAAGQYLTLDDDYSFYNETDNNTGVLINKDNFVLNGNGHILDAKNLSRIFNITANNVTLKDLVLINGNAQKGGAIYATGSSLIFDNFTFINNNGSIGGAIGLYGDSTLVCNNSKFIDNAGERGAIFVQKGELDLYNAYLTSQRFAKAGQIYGHTGSSVYIDNATFENIITDYSPAVYLTGAKARILNSKFNNLKANKSAGAVSLRDGGELYIENCEFINTTSSKNAGAVYVDIAGSALSEGNVTILDSVFKDTYSEFGGAYIQLAGKFWLNNTQFINTHAKYYGGAIYLSFVDSAISNCTFDSDGVELIDDYPTYGGAIYSDISTLNITDSRFINNLAADGNAIYAYDTSYNIKNTLFENNTNAIYSVFDKECSLENNTLVNDDISTNNTYYLTVVVGEGIELTLHNNTINVAALPSKFDLRDWGWVSTVRDQGWMNACWTFGMTGSLESALLKATDVKYDTSMNNMKLVMKYSPYGIYEVFEGGYNLASVSYLLSWLGAIPYDADTYDELGKITAVNLTGPNIHVQDLIFVPNNEIPNGTEIKKAVLKYGSLDVSYFGQSSYDEESPYYNEETYAQYVNVPESANHEVAIIGWDDNFPKEKFLVTPPGDGAWIIKNSWGPDFGDHGCMYVSYYDQSLLAYTPGMIANYAAVPIIENTVPYNKNYQYDLVWISNSEAGNGTISYMNVFEALETDAIAAVGTYFNGSGINYTVEIYVNDVLKLTQEGVSPYLGYHTIKLDEYIPIKAGDIFKAKITSNWVPYILLDDTRVHFTNGMSYVCKDGETWEDAYDLGYIASLKVYTVAIPFYTEDLVKIYKNDSKFEANIGVANQTVTFEVNGGTYNRTSDENGTARIAINLNPGEYTIKTTFNGTTVENSITVLPTLIADNLVKYFRNASQFYVTLIDGQGNPVAGQNVTMNINGVFYTRVTNENGTARLNINLNPGEYILTAIDPLTGLQMSYNITVLSILEADDLEMNYKDGSTFNVTVLDGQGNPLAGVSVTFNINGVFYNRTTDSNGIARLNINLMAGEYIITSEYDDLKISNTITIKG